MVVDLPTPGAPVMPTRIALPVRGNSSCTSAARGLLMIGALALDQRDGAGERSALAGADGAGKLADVAARCEPAGELAVMIVS